MITYTIVYHTHVHTLQAPAIRSQPQPVVARPYQYHSDIGQNALMLAIAVTIFLFVFGCFWGMICSCIGVVFASNVSTHMYAPTHTFMYAHTHTNTHTHRPPMLQGEVIFREQRQSIAPQLVVQLEG